MPSNMLIFDADYVSELTARMNSACELMASAVTSLKSASNHEGWKCKERTEILGFFDQLNDKLGRLDGGVNETTRILSGSVSRFASLEQQYESQAEGLSDEITGSFGFKGSVSGGNSGNGESGGSSSGGQMPGGSSAGGGSSGGAHVAGETGGNTPHGAGGHGGNAGGAGGGNIAGAAAGLGRSIMGGNKPSENRPSENRPGENRPGGDHNNSGTPSGTGGLAGAMNVNLPVTYIPDNPGAAARGVKDTKAVAAFAVTTAAGTITGILSAESSAASVPALVDAYNTARSVFESSGAIIASPTQAHTAERLTIAAGLVSLSGSSVTSVSVMGTAAVTGSSGAQASASAHSSGFSASSSGQGSFASNAGSLMNLLQGNSEASELQRVLGALTGSGSASSSAFSGSSGGGKQSFFDMIVSALKKAVSGEGSETASSSSASNPVAEFLGSYVMD